MSLPIFFKVPYHVNHHGWLGNFGESLRAGVGRHDDAAAEDLRTGDAPLLRREPASGEERQAVARDDRVDLDDQFVDFGQQLVREYAATAEPDALAVLRLQFAHLRERV